MFPLQKKNIIDHRPDSCNVVAVTPRLHRLAYHSPVSSRRLVLAPEMFDDLQTMSKVGQIAYRLRI